LFRVLLLTGQRKSDWAVAIDKEVNPGLELLTVPAARYKNGSDHEVPLTPKVLEVLEARPKRSHFLFSSTGRRPLLGMGWFKSKLDKIITERLGAPLEPWVIHDLRRTVRTRLSELGIDYEIKERVVGHRQPELSEIYDQFHYRPQKREALWKWQDRLLEIVGEGPTSDNVVRLHNSRAA